MELRRVYVESSGSTRYKGKAFRILFMARIHEKEWTMLVEENERFLTLFSSWIWKKIGHYCKSKRKFGCIPTMKTWTSHESIQPCIPTSTHPKQPLHCWRSSTERSHKFLGMLISLSLSLPLFPPYSFSSPVFYFYYDRDHGEPVDENCGHDGDVQAYWGHFRQCGNFSVIVTKPCSKDAADEIDRWINLPWPRVFYGGNSKTANECPENNDKP